VYVADALDALNTNRKGFVKKLKKKVVECRR
jgi:hypothetical protein